MNSDERLPSRVFDTHSSQDSQRHEGSQATSRCAEANTLHGRRRPPITLTSSTTRHAPLAFDGERLIPGASGPEIELEHVHRYLFAAELCVGKDVLDIASGDGYGSDILAQRARTVIGVDCDADAVAVARLRYPRDALRFEQGRCENIPCNDASVDVVVSFETIEHIDAHSLFFAEIQRVLRPGGILIMSTPDKRIYNAELAEPNHFHVHELERSEFEHALKERFHHVALLGQRVTFGSILTAPQCAPFDFVDHDPATFLVRSRPLEEGSVYWVAVASDAALPELHSGVYQGDARPNPISSILGGVRERDEEILRLRGEVNAAGLNLETTQQELAGAKEAARIARLRAAEAAAREEDIESQIDAMRLAAARRQVAFNQALEKLAAAEIECETLRAETTVVQRTLSDLRTLSAVAHEKAKQAEENALALSRADSELKGLRETAQALHDRLRSTEAELQAAQEEMAWRKTRGSTFFSDIAALPRLVRGWGPMRAMRILAEARVLRASGEFRELYYLRRYPDVSRAKTDPIIHYLTYGVTELRDPAPNFSTRAYIQRYPEIAGARVNPFFHFIRHGRLEGRSGAPGASNTFDFDLEPSRARAALPIGSDLSATTASAPGLRPDEIIHNNPGDLYAVRPDEIVKEESVRGRLFLEQYALLTDNPDYAGAVAALDVLSARAAENEATTPVISIIVPVYGQLAYTLNCLHALIAHRSKRAFEIILVDDASPDETERWLGALRAIRYCRVPTNGGFIRACNTGGELARGRYVVFLNNDTRVVDGWLDALIDSFDDLPNAGLVGSKLFYPDGSLQEAGGIIWSDASAWNFGRNDDPNRPEYCYARSVDYVSGAAIAIEKDLWDQLGGFDLTFAPAYCEDSDLALRVRHRAGRTVWMQPLSRVIHYEGKTSGTDVTKGVKAYQVSNAEKLKARWRETLASHRVNAELPLMEKDRGVGLRALVLDANTPEPHRDAGSVTCVGLIEVLQQAGYKVTFAAESNLLFLPGPTSALQRQGVEVLYAPYCADIDEFLRTRGEEFDFVLIFRKEVARRRLKSIRRHMPRARIAFHCSDLHFLREQREAELNNDANALKAAERSRSEELKVIESVDVSIVHSTHEHDLLTEAAPSARIYTFPWILDPEPEGPSFAARRDIAFLGGYRHPPNVDAVLFFAREIWPIVKQSEPEMRFIVAGADAPPELEALHGRNGIVVEGFVPDLSAFYSKVRLAIAPLRYGAGIKGKVAVSLANGVPTVLTSCAAEGMSLADGTCVVIRDTPEEFAREIVSLYRDEKRWRAMAQTAREFVAHTYGSRLALGRITDILRLAGAPVGK